jgi:thiamine kinase-like enzyme
MPISLPALSSLRYHRDSPLIATTFQAVLLNSLANIIAQFLEIRHSRLTSTAVDPKRVSIDIWRVLQFVIWTLLTVPPNFRWQQFLERRFPAYYDGERTVKREADDEGDVSHEGVDCNIVRANVSDDSHLW